MGDLLPKIRPASAFLEGPHTPGEEKKNGNIFLGTNIAPQKGIVEDDCPFPKVGLC